VRDGWQFVLNESSVTFLLGCRATDRLKLLHLLELLTENPYQQGDFQARDAVGRPVELKFAGNFLITFWADHGTKELRILRIEAV
jgi:hypothetical protein